MKKFGINIFIALLLGLTLSCLSSCEKDDSSGPLAQKVTLTLSRYYNASGSTTSVTWGENDMAGLVLTGQNSSNVDYAAPILPGSSSSMFLFTILPEMNEPQTLVSFYPSNADISCTDGILMTELSATQTGTVSPLLLGKAPSQKLNTYNGAEMSLSQLFCVMYITIEKGNYAIEKAEISSNGGEGIAGEILLDVDNWKVTASSSKVTVTPQTPIDCSETSQTMVAMLAPVTLSEGYTVVLYDTDGNTLTINDYDEVILDEGGKLDTDRAYSDNVSKIVFCGDNMVYMIDVDLAIANGWESAVLWSWDATTIASTLGMSTSQCNHLDDCKLVDKNTKLLVTSSDGWCVLLDYETKDVLFYTTQCPNAHSAELLPDNRLVVACSEGTSSRNNAIQLYDVSTPNKVLDQVELYFAHGVVWNSTTERLYALGNENMPIFSLANWNTSSPILKLETTISTPKSNCHDLTYVDSNTLCVAGNGAYLYTIGTNSFSEMTLFSSRTALKSVNYNADNGELWYTDATVPEGDYDWSTHTLRHAASGSASGSDKTITIPNMNCYKVRVMNW